MDDFVKKLDFNSDTFDGMKRDMNFVMQRLLGNMIDKGSTEGKMTISIEVKFDTEYVPNYDPDIEGESRRIEKPKFSHKVTSSVQIKDEKKGNIDTEMELIFDEQTGEYVIKPVANTEQRTIFDKDFQSDLGNEEEQTEEDTGQKNIPQLPGPTDETVIDADFTEVEACAEADQKEDDFEDVTDDIMGNDDETDDYGYDEPDKEE